MKYEKYYVAFIDILGFKEIINHGTCDEILSIFSEFKRPLCGIYFGAEQLVNVEEINYKIMSDSIVFYVSEKTKNALFGLTAFCHVFQGNLLGREKPILSRGGIAYGDFYINQDIMFGPALTQAYMLESTNAKYPRIIMTNSLLSKDESDNSRLNTFEDFDGFWTINIFPYSLSKGKTGEEVFSRFEKHVVDVLNNETNNSIREKYIYLKNRIKTVKAGGDEIIISKKLK